MSIEGAQIPENRKLTPKGELRKKVILEKALELFGEKGYHATTMDDIAKAAYTGKGTVYWYWKSKEEIFLELLTVKFETYLKALSTAAEMNLPAPEKVLMIIAEVGNIFVKYRKFCKLVFLLISDDSERFSPKVVAITKGYYRKFKEIIERVIRDGQSEKSIDGLISPEDLATIMVGALDGILIQENIFGKTYSINKLGETFLALLKKGVFVKSVWQ
ncbi:MAG: hypothetical protein Kow0090_10100 [Myxococcota bacterium]